LVFFRSFSALFCFDKHSNSRKISEKFTIFKDGLAYYEKLKNPLLNSTNINDPNQKRLEKTKSCVKSATDLISFLDLFERNSFEQPFDQYFKNLDYLISVGLNICNLSYLIDTINSSAQVLYENIIDNTNVMIFSIYL
jgi:hypothetical protein